MSNYVRVMDGLKSNASGEEFKLDEVITANVWNPTETEPEKMGGFNFSTEDKILRYIFRGDTIYDVIIPFYFYFLLLLYKIAMCHILYQISF